MTQLSDEILIAYADEELGAEQIRAVDAVFAADAETLARMKKLDASRQRLSRAFQSMLQAEARERAASQPRRQPVSPQPAKQAPRKRKRGFLVPGITVALMLLSLGVFVGYFVAQSPSGRSVTDIGDFWNEQEVEKERHRIAALSRKHSDPATTGATVSKTTESDEKWYERLAVRHAADAKKLMTNLDGSQKVPELLLFEMSKKGPAPDLVPGLTEEKMSFVGAETIDVSSKPYARLVYRDTENDDVPVTLYVGETQGESLTLERGFEGEQNYVRWTQKGRRYLIIGMVPPWRLIVLSVAVQRQLVR